MKRKISDPDQESVDSNRKREIIGPNEDIDSESKKQKKVRTTFTGRQIFELEKMFETKKYLSSSERTELAKMLNVTEQQVIHSSSSYEKMLHVSKTRECLKKKCRNCKSHTLIFWDISPKIFQVYSKAPKYTAPRYTDPADTQFELGPKFFQVPGFF